MPTDRPQFPSRIDQGTQAAVAAAHVHGQLKRWLIDAAYPLWARAGYDHVRGGFHERLASEGGVAADARRARVQLRQIYAFAKAASLGWSEDPLPLVSNGLERFLKHYRRPDGLFRTLCAADGTALDERAFLYDQAFGLLALAECYKLMGRSSRILAETQALLGALQGALKRRGPGFDSGVPERAPLLANPHMHLLEAALAWQAISDAPVWKALINEIVVLALEQIIDGHSGLLREFFNENWLPLAGLEGRFIETGHLFEWGWLLQRCGEERAVAAGARLIELGERHGVRRGVVVNALLDDFSVHDAQARLWPQTERLKAACQRSVGDARHWTTVVECAEVLLRYLARSPEGLWFDCLTVHDRFVDEPAPASTFYHIIGAITEFGEALMQAAPMQSKPRSPLG